MPKHFIVFFSVKTFTSNHFYHPIKHTKQKGNFFSGEMLSINAAVLTNKFRK